MTKRHATPTTLRQGDVLLRETTKRPSAKATRVTDKGRVILAYGEVTGHAHQVVDDVAAPARVDNADPIPAAELFENPDGSRILVVSRPAALTHEEHGRIGLPPANYEVIIQREYSPEAVRNVAD